MTWWYSTRIKKGVIELYDEFGVDPFTREDAQNVFDINKSHISVTLRRLNEFENEGLLRRIDEDAWACEEACRQLWETKYD